MRPRATLLREELRLRALKPYSGLMTDRILCRISPASVTKIRNCPQGDIAEERGKSAFPGEGEGRRGNRIADRLAINEAPVSRRNSLHSARQAGLQPTEHIRFRKKFGRAETNGQITDHFLKYAREEAKP